MSARTKAGRNVRTELWRNEEQKRTGLTDILDVNLLRALVPQHQLLVQLPCDVVDALLSQPEPLADSISDLSDESLHVEVFQSGSDDGVSEKRGVGERKHETGGNEACRRKRRKRDEHHRRQTARAWNRRPTESLEDVGSVKVSTESRLAGDDTEEARREDKSAPASVAPRFSTTR